MKRPLLAIFCSIVILVQAGSAIASPASDRDMASRYMQAAQSGDDEAQFYIGSLYSAGVGVARSDEEAFRWLGRAANQGHSHSMLILAGLYAIGRGVEKNNVEAYKWAYIVNGASKVEEFRNGSRQLMGVLEGRMSGEEINLAKSRASQWRAVPAAAVAPSPPAYVSPAVVTPPPAVTAPVGAATPAPVTSAAPASAGQPPATTSDNSSTTDTPGKNSLDSFFKDELPNLRKKFGF
jgi:hypothetical protein